MLFQLTTNNAGDTEYVPLYAPDKIGGTYPGGYAYATYNVSVKMSGYVSQNIIGTELFDEVSSIQPVSLKPLTGTYRYTEENVFLPPHKLDIPPPYPGVPLTLGSRGVSVRTLQSYINRLADRAPSVPHVSVDGTFGILTEVAVKAAQNTLGLIADGTVDPVAWDAIVR
jgi:peptidoglycan hydrolase-like protein with peptidoglycan-binding domain